MVDAPRRVTSIPLQFNFAQSKRSTPSLKDTTCSITAIVQPKKRPPPIRVPHDTPEHRSLPAVLKREWTPVEIANFPPRLRRKDLLDLLEDYNFSPDFDFPATPQFIRPFRITLMAVSVEEAQRMVMDLDGLPHSGREISVKMLGNTHHTAAVQEIAHELKNNIISTHTVSKERYELTQVDAARILYPNHAETILEVRELVKDRSHFAFLQKRSPVTIYSHPDAHAFGAQGKASWEFVAGGAIAEPMAGGDRYVPRLEALTDLLENVEKQGVARKIWAKWSGSQMLVAHAL